MGSSLSNITKYNIKVRTDRSKTEGIIVMPTAVSDPPKVGAVKAAPETRKLRPKRNVSIVAGKAKEKASA